MKRLFYDTEAAWYYTEDFFRSLYNEYTEQEKQGLFNGSFDTFIAETIKYEPVFEVFAPVPKTKTEG